MRRGILIGVVIGVLAGILIGFFWTKITWELIDIQSFRNKEVCIKYFDKYYNFLKDTYNYDELSQYISDYEIFYNKSMNTCIAAYTLNGMHTIYGQKYPTFSRYIVDYFNGQKELFWCSVDTYADSESKCMQEREQEKEKYKSN